MKKIIPLLRDILIVLAGNILYACGVAFFILPGGLITGGTTGIALFVQHVFQIPISAFVLCFNAAMFLLGFAVLGRKFAATTALSTFSYPLALELIQRLAGDYVLTEDPVLCMVFGGFCIGGAIGVVIRTGASTGGMDIPPLVLNRLFHLPVSVMIYVFDILILLLQAFQCSGEEILYGILLILIYTVVIDKCLVVGTSKMEVKVVSRESEKIRKAILFEIDRGVTMLKGQTGYLQEETDIVLSVVSNRELIRVRRLIHGIDSSAFIIISRVTEVRGRGFTEEKKYMNMHREDGVHDAWESKGEEREITGQD